MANLYIKQMESNDLDDVMIIENECFKTPWSREAFESELLNDVAVYFLLVENQDIIGYCGMWLIMDEAHITNVAVRNDHQGKGYGQIFLSSIIDQIVQSEINHMTLEVRVSNKAAIRLYEKLGFISHGIRPKYYQDNKEDALIMWKELIKECDEDEC